MKKSISALSFALSLVSLSGLAFAHGGTYRGPGDTVPPGGSGPSGPSTGGPSSPSGPSTGGPSSPSGPGPSGPSTGGGPGPSTSGPKTGGAVVGPDLSAWTFWWEFNKDPFLNLKAAVHAGGPITGSDEFFMGREGGKGARDSLKPTDQQVRGKVVPALQKALAEETNNDIVTGCLIALGKIGGDPNFVEIVKKHLASNNQEISETAAVALGILSYPNSIETLVHLAKDTKEGRKLVGDKTEVPFRTRAFALYGLGLIGHAATEDKVRDEVVATLREALQADKSSYKDVKVGSILALGLVQDTDRKAVEDLRRILADQKTDRLVRAHCPLSLAKLTAGLEKKAPQRVQVVEDLVKILKDKKEKDFVRQSAIYALGLLSQPGDESYEDAVTTVKQSIKESSDEQERNFGFVALGKMGGPDAQTFLVTQLQKGRGTSRPWIAIALGVLGRNLADAGKVPDRIIADKLHELLSEGGNPAFLGSYAIALGILRDSTAKDLLIETLKKVQEDELRGYCCVALGMISARETISEIQEIVKKATRKPELLQQAAIGLGLLGDKKLVPDLIDLLKESKTLAVYAAVASALGYIGDQRSIDPLIETLQNKSNQPVGRGFSAVALGIICDKEMLPWNSKIAVDLNYRATVTTLTDKAGGTGICDIL